MQNWRKLQLSLLPRQHDPAGFNCHGFRVVGREPGSYRVRIDELTKLKEIAQNAPRSSRLAGPVGAGKYDDLRMEGFGHLPSLEQ